MAGAQAQRRHRHALAFAGWNATHRHRASARRSGYGLSAALEHRHRPMKRVLLKIAVTVGAIALAGVVVTASLLTWATLSASGLQFVWDRVAQRLPPGLTIETIEGRLAGPLVLGGIALRTEALELRIERAELHWNP